MPWGEAQGSPVDVERCASRRQTDDREHRKPLQGQQFPTCQPAVSGICKHLSLAMCLGLKFPRLGVVCHGPW
eukprot:8086053-Lingulodinium_polyedra.AAC.1